MTSDNETRITPEIDKALHAAHRASTEHVATLTGPTDELELLRLNLFYQQKLAEREERFALAELLEKAIAAIQSTSPIEVGGLREALEECRLIIANLPHDEELLLAKIDAALAIRQPFEGGE